MHTLSLEVNLAAISRAGLVTIAKEKYKQHSSCSNPLSSKNRVLPRLRQQAGMNCSSDIQSTRPRTGGVTKWDVLDTSKHDFATIIYSRSPLIDAPIAVVSLASKFGVQN